MEGGTPTKTLLFATRLGARLLAWLESRYNLALVQDAGDRWRFTDAALLGRLHAGSPANDRAPAAYAGAPDPTAAATH
jgi:hypothetical protein